MNLIIEKEPLSAESRKQLSCMTVRSVSVICVLPHFSHTGVSHTEQYPIRCAPTEPQCVQMLWSAERCIIVSLSPRAADRRSGSKNRAEPFGHSRVWQVPRNVSRFHKESSQGPEAPFALADAAPADRSAWRPTRELYLS